MEEALAEDGSREGVLGAALAELAAGPAPRVMVVEDAHWADEATVNLLAVLGRRIERGTGRDRRDAAPRRGPARACGPRWPPCRRRWCGRSTWRRCRPPPWGRSPGAAAARPRTSTP